MAGLLPERIAKLVTQAKGTEFWIVKTITSSNITTAAQALTATASGRLAVKQVILETDATGVAGPTDFHLKTDNASGLGTTPFAAEAVSNLGANATRAMNGGGDDSTNDKFLSITGVPTIIEAGKKITYLGTVSTGTGAGTIRVAILLQRIDEGADIKTV
jgi:hypothetical protein